MIKILDEHYKATNIRYINEDNIAYLQSKVILDKQTLVAIDKILKGKNLYFGLNEYDTNLLAEKEFNKILLEHPVTDIDYWKQLNPNVRIETTIILTSGYELKLKQDEVNLVIEALEKKVDKNED